MTHYSNFMLACLLISLRNPSETCKAKIGTNGMTHLESVEREIIAEFNKRNIPSDDIGR